MIVKTCKNHGDLTSEWVYKSGACKLCRSEYKKVWKKENPDKVKIQKDKYYAKNKDRIRDKTNIRSNNYYHRNKQTINEKNVLNAKERRENLKDNYIKKFIAKKHRISPKEIPQWMIDVKRQIIKLRRYMRSICDSKDM